MTDIRYLTSWKNAATLQVMQESYEGEADAATLKPVIELDIKSGTVKDQVTTGTAAPR